MDESLRELEREHRGDPGDPAARARYLAALRRRGPLACRGCRAELSSPDAFLEGQVVCLTCWSRGEGDRELVLARPEGGSPHHAEVVLRVEGDRWRVWQGRRELDVEALARRRGKEGARSCPGHEGLREVFGEGMHRGVDSLGLPGASAADGGWEVPFATSALMHEWSGVMRFDLTAGRVVLDYEVDYDNPYAGC